VGEDIVQALWKHRGYRLAYLMLKVKLELVWLRETVRFLSLSVNVLIFKSTTELACESEYERTRLLLTSGAYVVFNKSFIIPIGMDLCTA
jgi:hypothetical protein